MQVSLDEAIEIHAKVLAYRYGDRAPSLARDKADRLQAAGDGEGRVVWQRVAVVAEALLDGSGAAAAART